jgi:hypothetical protein
MKIIAPVMGLLLLCACAGSSGLSKEERSKVDPAIMKLLSGAVVDDNDYDVSLRPDGAKEYEIIVRLTSTDDLRSAGIRIQTAAGSVATARVTLSELKNMLHMPSVKFVQNGSRNTTH